MAALEAVLIDEGQSGRGLFRKLRDAVPPEKRAVIARYLVGIAAADGEVSADEVRSLRAACRGMEIPATTLDDLLGSSTDGELGTPAVVRQKSRGRMGENIPPRDDDANGASVSIDPDKLKLVMEQTDAVQEILAEAMADDEERAHDEEAQSVEPTEHPAFEDHESLPGHLQEFKAHVLTRSEWPKAVLDAWCKERRLMLGGVIAELNEWALETFGDILVEEDARGICVHHETMEVTT